MKKNFETFISTTVAYCAHCKKTETGAIVGRSNGVYLQRLCKEQTDATQTEVKLAASYDWYIQRITHPQEVHSPKHCHAPRNGCPLDCGPCQQHTNDIHLPVFSITNDCNLDCPICFTHNRPDKTYYKTVSDTQKIVDNILKQNNPIEVINLTGGEPTLHPHFFDIVDVCKRPEINRITVNTNGLTIADDVAFAKKIKSSGIQLVLSLNTFCPQKSIAIHGKDITNQKKRTLKILEELDIPTTILLVAIKGLNETDIAQIAGQYINKGFVKNIVIQNMTFTGANGATFSPRAHITLDEVENALSSTSLFHPSDFFALGSAHPLCYSVAYYISCGERLIPFTQLLSRHTLTSITARSYLLSSDKNLRHEFMDGISRLWAEEGDEQLVALLKQFITRLYPTNKQLSKKQREHIAQEMIKTVYIHSHMDKDNFDIDRISRCADIVPDESGAMIPACAYNLIYREQDQRFWIQSKRDGK